MSEPKPLRNRKGKQIYAGITALAAGLAFIVWISSHSEKAEVISAYTALYVTYATAICGLCGVGIWGNVREHEAPAKANGQAQPTPPLDAPTPPLDARHS